ncbi:hypothetical protein SAMN04488026_11099 [Aliiruegeria lutimaris]|uniref:Helix-turn-helix domain-containing protein n=1 Tax=Aliiruegeria lutimaris TaxID=571298 RepID=A0A1G9ME88_9RHOB|nr:hypothetical protein SAMN04488026_11099 [Aliiruegeria lutimaris]
MSAKVKSNAADVLAESNGEIMFDALYTPRDAASLLGVSGRTLERRRRDGLGPRVTLLWENAPPRYRGSDLLEFIERGRRPFAKE